MSPSRIFILRPVATTLLMIGILLVGLSPTMQLPVSALPEVDYPTIQVVTFYPGADPEVMASSVTAPLERQFGQVPGLSQMTSTSSLRQLDHHSAVQSRSRTSMSLSRRCRPLSMLRQLSCRTILPNPPIYSKVNPADAPILTLGADFGHRCLFSKVEDLADTTLAQKISQLSGRRSRLNQRRTKACRAHPGQSHSFRVVWFEP